jgi:hypothetical protein
MKKTAQTQVTSLLGILVAASTAVAGNIPTNHTPNILLDTRARYEYGDQLESDVSHAATLRARVGLESQTYNGFSGLVEFESTHSHDTDSYIGAGKTVIADPESTELNRAQLQFSCEDNTVIAGRQRIILDNARFVGNVGWRQNEQTFDAVSYKNTMVDGLSVYYAFIDQVNRIFGSNAPNGSPADDFDSESHLFNASYSCPKGGHKLTVYGYLLDFDNTGAAAAASSDTFGLSYDFKGKVAEDYTVNGHAEFALQQDAGDNPADYCAPYFHVNGKLAREGYSTTLGVEVLGSDNGATAFQTPLATGHKFNGFNDQFLTTPADGLKDLYLGIGLPVPKVPVQLIYHYFMSETGSMHYGQEFDAVAAHALNKNTKAIAKLSHYDAEDFGEDRTRFSVELNFKY